MVPSTKVMVGLSGGVDSSVAALRLQAAGYDVVGVFIKVWHPDFMVCNWEEERLDAMRVAAKLKLPFLTCNAEAAYKEHVADFFIKEYMAGRTPNPDILCNQFVKFGAFLEFAKSYNVSYVATGHYARVTPTSDGPTLLRGIDTTKDQSYFLWSLAKEQLDHVLFPIGDSLKSQIRTEAHSAALPTAVKHDSQGICFLGHVDIPEFLSHYITLVPGFVLDEHGHQIGTHQGALVYTLGQRHGFTLTAPNSERPPLYVIAKDMLSNTITVSATKPTWQRESNVQLSDLTLRSPLVPGDKLHAQFRYRQTPIPITITDIKMNTLTLSVDIESEETSLGQSCVLYRGDLCLGGGIIA